MLNRLQILAGIKLNELNINKSNVDLNDVLSLYYNNMKLLNDKCWVEFVNIFKKISGTEYIHPIPNTIGDLPQHKLNLLYKVIKKLIQKYSN